MSTRPRAYSEEKGCSQEGREESGEEEVDPIRAGCRFAAQGLNGELATEPLRTGLLMAHKKGQGTSRNGRDSNSQRLGFKAFGGQLVPGGTIIVRQRGTRVKPGLNVGRGKDDTLFAKITGRIKFLNKGSDGQVRDGRACRSEVGVAELRAFAGGGARQSPHSLAFGTRLFLCWEASIGGKHLTELRAEKLRT